MGLQTCPRISTMADVQNVGDAKSDTSSDQGDNDYSPLGVDLKALPPIMRGRVKALKNIQLDTIKAETEYYREVHQLDLKYQAKYDEINKKREQVVNGSHLPLQGQRFLHQQGSNQ